MQDRKKQTHNAQQTVLDLLAYAAGGALYAAAVRVFLAPNDILLGGFTGISTVLHHLFGTPIGTVVFLLNIPLLVLACRKFGAAFLLRTGLATLLSSAFMDLFALFLPVYTGDRLLGALFGGILGGAGLGLVFLRGATTGGADILSKLLRLKFPQMSMGRLILLLDLAVVLLSFAVYRSFEAVLYSLVAIYVSAQAVDLAQTGLSHDKLLFIVTEKGETAVREIVETLDRGVSVLDVRGGYTGEKRQMLFCAVRASDAARLAKAVRALDDSAFIVISDISDVLGEGFKSRTAV
ncbi:MAG TPA: YitT family protein [Candidatus Fimenecus excrementigallinarum]|uniref:YitT family protein n=1 Tax=Candidatus Fimenecus excrementigallinarum TaxID=2840816 RepID=A0A9D1LEP7_9FIRM|nr:YitT family protein [Candidatus Fimenecus excrementigallinarum]